MSQKLRSYRVIDLPLTRRDTPNLLELYWWKHSVYGLLEVDVTVARQFIEAYREQTGEGLSFTGYLAFCLARAVDEDKSVQAYMKGRKQLVVFDDVDVGLTVERKIDGTRVPAGHVIRRANHKTFLEIHHEIRSVQTQPPPPNKGMAPWLRTGLLLPWPLDKLFVAAVRAAMRRDPTVMVSLGGTVAVTAVGMFGHHSGWALTPPSHSVLLVVGGLSASPPSWMGGLSLAICFA